MNRKKKRRRKGDQSSGNDRVGYNRIGEEQYKIGKGARLDLSDLM